MAKKIEFDLDYPFLKKLYEKQKGKCFYTQIPMILKSDPNRIGSQASFNVLSVDRVDSLRGYVKDNVVLALNCINMLKAHHKIDDIRDVMKSMYLSEQENFFDKVSKIFKAA